MKRNFILESKNGQDQVLKFGKYEIIRYKGKKSIKKYHALYYLVDCTKGYKDKRLSAVYTRGPSLKEFYFDSRNNYYQATIENNKLVIDEIERTEYSKIIDELKNNIQGVAS